MQRFGDQDVTRVRWIKDHRAASVILRPDVGDVNVGDEFTLEGQVLWVEKMLWPKNGLWGGIVLLSPKQ